MVLFTPVYLDHIVIDELYLMIRKWMCYSEILLKNSYSYLGENIGKSQKSLKHLSSIVNANQSCGVSFSVWKSTERDSRGDFFLKSIEWTSLTGSDMKKIVI